MTKRICTALLAMFVMATLSMGAQTTTTTTTKTKPAAKKVAKESETEREIRELREQLAAQQAQIDSLKQQNAAKDAAVSTAQQQAQTATSQAQQAASQAQAAESQAQSVSSNVQQNTSDVNSLKSTITTLQTTNSGLARTISDTKKDVTDAMESPAAIHYKGVTITPIGYLAAESVYRSRSINSDINTSFNSTPFMNSDQAHTSEFNGSGRQSRLGALVSGRLPIVTMNGFYEADFLGAGVTSNNNQSNSYVLRQRQMWAQAKFNRGFTFTGGQMWSLVTETKHATDNATENLPMLIDAAYHVGFSWQRQYGLRFQQAVTPKLTLAMSIEQAQTLFSAAGSAPTNFFFGNIGTGGGLYNLNATYANNVSPDFMVKAAADPGYGHYEIGGLVRFFRDRYYPAVTSAVGATNSTTMGGGFFANARFPVTKFADIGFHVLSGDGVGRYGASSLPDVTVKITGTATDQISTLEPLRADQGLFSLETHWNKKLDVFGYAGGEYVQRTVYINPVTGQAEGYAPLTLVNTACNTEPADSTSGGLTPATSACPAVTRAVIAGTGGFVYRFYNGPRGRFQYSMTYTYLKREGWTGVGGAPNGNNNMVFTGFRYYIP